MKERDYSPGAKTRRNDLKQGAGRPDKEEKLMRERSIKTNRRQKFIECLSSSDVNISMHIASFSGVESYIAPSGELRKIAWAGIPSNLRPMAWQLLLVCVTLDLYDICTHLC